MLTFILNNVKLAALIEGNWKMSNFNNIWKPRLDYLASLESGWLNGEGDPVPASVIETVDEFLIAVSRHPSISYEGKRPGLFPLGSAPGVQVEWGYDGVDWDVEFTESGAAVCAFSPDEDFEVVVPAGEFLVERLVGEIRGIQAGLPACSE